MGFLSDAWDVVTSPFVSAANVVNDLAHLRISSAVNNAVGTLASLNPLQQLDGLSGGLIKDKISNAPLLGQTTSNWLGAGETLAAGQGNTGTLLGYAKDSAILGASALGGSALYAAYTPSLATSLVGATTLDKLASGDLSGAINTGAGLVGDVDLGIGLPGGVEDVLNTVSPYLGGSGGAQTSLNGKTGGLPSPAAQNKGTTDNLTPILIAGAATIGGYFLLRKK